tara:strand:- start:813 stop:1034 length:222 start_codon:yes stop_codon:yes gene_type:complete
MADFLGRWEMPSASEKKKENKVKLRQRINKDIDVYLKNGGEIKKISKGEVNIETIYSTKQQRRAYRKSQSTIK